MSQCCDVSSETIDKMSKQMSALQESLVKERQHLGKGILGEYIFTRWDGSKATLTQLFGKRDELIVIHNMGVHCPYCTMWADGFNGLYPHLNNRAAFVVTSNDSIDVQKGFALKRGWRFPMVSSQESGFFEDLGFSQQESNEMGKYMPGVSTFQKQKDGTVKHIASAQFGPGDLFCPTFHLFDLLPGGTGDWQAKFIYPETGA